MKNNQNIDAVLQDLVNAGRTDITQADLDTLTQQPHTGMTMSCAAIIEGCITDESEQLGLVFKAQSKSDFQE